MYYKEGFTKYFQIVNDSDTYRCFKFADAGVTDALELTIDYFYYFVWDV